MYGLFFAAALWCLTFIVNLSATLFAIWLAGEPFSWSALQNAAESTQVSFALIAVGSKCHNRADGRARARHPRAAQIARTVFLNAFGTLSLSASGFPSLRAKTHVSARVSETLCPDPGTRMEDKVGSAAMGPPCKPETRRGGSAPF